MKLTSIFFVILLCATLGAEGQSKSFEVLKDKFINQPEVHSFSVGGWVSRLILKVAGEYEFREAIQDVQEVRVITIPANQFKIQQVTVNGFKKILKSDSFEELAVIKDHGDDVTVYIREERNNKNFYFLLIENEREVVGLEIKGFIDPQILKKQSDKLASKNL